MMPPGIYDRGDECRTCVRRTFNRGGVCTRCLDGKVRLLIEIDRTNELPRTVPALYRPGVVGYRVIGLRCGLGAAVAFVHTDPRWDFDEEWLLFVGPEADAERVVRDMVVDTGERHPLAFDVMELEEVA